ncbi:MAG: T9SS type A sorting domain-containing protein [Ignavibacteriales bacterium]|nr:T9SS type A sorting domain-containing protein [Ignavibacteriales bacterium]
MKQLSLLVTLASLSFSQTYEWTEVGYTSRLPHEYTFFIDTADHLNTYDWFYKINYASKDEGKTWDTLYSTIIRKIIGFTIYFADSVGRSNRTDLVYSNTGGSQYFGTDSSHWWYEMRDSLMTLSMPWVSYANDSTIFLTAGLLFSSIDSGGHWKPLDLLNVYTSSFYEIFLHDTLWFYYKNQDVTSVLADKFDNVLVSSSKYGIFYSTNKGSYWTRQNSGLIDTSVLILRKNSKGELFALTMSGKIFKGTAKPSSVIQKSNNARSFSLDQNFPNPFNPSTTIAFTLLKQNNTSLKIYNTLGQEIVSLIDGPLGSGEYAVPFHAAHLPSGIYFYVLRSGGFVHSKKMILLK